MGMLISIGILISCGGQKKEGTSSLEYNASIRADKKKYSVLAGNKLHIGFQLKNVGQKTWSSSVENPCLLSYHLLDKDGQTVQYDNRRFTLPKDTLPGQKIELSINVKSPLQKGQYILEFDLLREGLSWFKDTGSKTLKVLLSVLNREWIEDKMDWTLDYGTFTKFTSNVEELNTL